MDEPRKQPPPPNIPSEPTTEADESPLEQPEPLSPPPVPVNQNIPQPPTPPPQIRKEAQPFQPEQKRVFLNRGEVRGMQKDMARVREEEAAKERERIASLKSQQETQKEYAAIEKIRTSALAT